MEGEEVVVGVGVGDHTVVGCQLPGAPGVIDVAMCEQDAHDGGVQLGEVGTDPLRLTAVSKENREWDNTTWLQYDGKYPVWLESKGYLAPPLDGVWASAPYFHNGAAPTLWAVMNPNARPKVWKRTENGYDAEKVGLEVEVLDAVPEGLSERVRRMYYDTSHVGNSAAGHDFPDILDDEEKRAVIEYLKTL